MKTPPLVPVGPASRGAPRALFEPPPWRETWRGWRPNWFLVGTVGVSVALHVALMLVRIVDPEGFNRVFQDTPLEVILVNARSTEAPSAKPQAIAQATLAGGGEAEEGRATSPLAPSLTTSVGNDEVDAERHKIEQIFEEQQQLLTQMRRDIALMPVPDPRKGALTQAERDQEERRQQKLRMLAEIEKRINEENARPRKRYISPATREEAYAVYYDGLRHKIEARGTRDFPALNGRKLYGELTMNLTIDNAGRVIEAEVLRSSGSRALDGRAIAIARAAGPFGNFSEAMRKQADQIVITSRFRFTRNDGLEATMTNSQ
jgi:protein TonB